MKINDTWHITRDQHNFILEHHSPTEGGKKLPGGGLSKSGVSVTKTFYPTLERACNRLVQKSIITNDLETIIFSINQSTIDIVRAIETNENNT